MRRAWRIRRRRSRCVSTASCSSPTRRYPVGDSFLIGERELEPDSRLCLDDDARRPAELELAVQAFDPAAFPRPERQRLRALLGGRVDGGPGQPGAGDGGAWAGGRPSKTTINTHGRCAGGAVQQQRGHVQAGVLRPGTDRARADQLGAGGNTTHRSPFHRARLQRPLGLNQASTR